MRGRNTVRRTRRGFRVAPAAAGASASVGDTGFRENADVQAMPYADPTRYWRGGAVPFTANSPTVRSR